MIWSLVGIIQDKLEQKDQYKDLKELCHVFRVHFVDNTSVEPLHNGHLGDRIKWPLQRGLNKRQCMDCPPE